MVISQFHLRIDFESFRDSKKLKPEGMIWNYLGFSRCVERLRVNFSKKKAITGSQPSFGLAKEVVNNIKKPAKL